MPSATTTASGVESLASAARLDAYRDAMLRPDAPLDAFLGYLRELSNATVTDLAVGITDPDKARAVALGYMQGALQAVASHATSRFSPQVRSCPASVLGDVVGDFLVPCAAPSCGRRVAPWFDGSTCGDPDCGTEFARAFGEVAS